MSKYKPKKWYKKTRKVMLDIKLLEEYINTIYNYEIELETIINNRYRYKEDNTFYLEVENKKRLIKEYKEKAFELAKKLFDIKTIDDIFEI